MKSSEGGREPARHKSPQRSLPTLYDQIKAFFTTCAQELLKEGDQKGAARLAKASTHWLRHTHASHAIAGGMPIEVAQQNLGHASLATTTVYVKTEGPKPAILHFGGLRPVCSSTALLR